MKMTLLRKNFLKHFSNLAKYSLLPVLMALYPAAFHYANNVRLVPFSSFFELCLFLASVGLILYLVIALLTRGKYWQAACGTFLMLVFFHTYGFAFDWLRALDLIQIETYNFLPFWLLLAAYLAWAVTRLNDGIARRLWQALTLVMGVLLIFNLVKIVPGEIEKQKSASKTNPVAAVNYTETDTTNRRPDIYYLIFDEAAGFGAAQRYWHLDGVDEFLDFLNSRGFYVAAQSHGHTTGTLYELATRLNYQEYPLVSDDEYYDIYDAAVASNRVMDYLKKHGYTLIAYDERRFYLSTLSPLPVDYLIEESPEKYAGIGIGMDDYKILVLENTILRSCLSFGDKDPSIVRHKNMILFTEENVTSEQFSSPKFVYVHLFLPHVPFVFTENGNILPGSGFANWQRYENNYSFFLHVARQMIENILAKANPANPPVIILQSDHGARNITEYPYTNSLEDYPEEYKTWIVNALYLPGCEDAPLTQDMDPINTFPIVFNCYFDAGIPLIER